MATGTNKKVDGGGWMNGATGLLAVGWTAAFLWAGCETAAAPSARLAPFVQLHDAGAGDAAWLDAPWFDAGLFDGVAGDAGLRSGPRHRASVATQAVEAPRDAAGMTRLPASWQHLHVEAGHVVVRAPATLGDSPPPGDARVLERGDITRVRWDLAPDLAPADLQGVAGERLRLYHGTQPVCEATAGALHVQVRFLTPWVYEDVVEAPLDVGDFAAATWGHELAEPMFAAELVDVVGDCAEATWARSAHLPAPAIHATRPPTQTVEKAWVNEALRRTRALPAWRDSQSDYRAAREDPVLVTELQELYGRPLPKRWDDLEPPEIRLVRGDDEAWLLVSMRAGEGCGGFQGTVDALWKLELGPDARRPIFVLRGAGYSEDSGIVGGADLDGDGELELLLEGGILRGHLEAIDRLEVPHEFECPC